jgi:hypothetical protein
MIAGYHTREIDLDKNIDYNVNAKNDTSQDEHNVVYDVHSSGLLLVTDMIVGEHTRQY